MSGVIEIISNIKSIYSRVSGEEKSPDEPPIGHLVYVSSAVINVLALALPLSILQIYDRVLPNATFETLWALIFMLIAFVGVDLVLKYARASVVNWSATAFTHQRLTNSLATMLSTRPSRFKQTMTSECLERLNAVSALGNHLGGQSRIIAVDIIFIPIFAAVIVLVGGSLFLAVTGLLIAFGYFALRRTNTLNALINDQETTDARRQDFVIEALDAIQTVKASAMEAQMNRRFERLQSAASVVTKNIISLVGDAQNYASLYSSLSIIAIVGVGAVYVLNGRLSLGALACCMLLSSQLLQPVLRSLASWNEIQQAKQHRARIKSIQSDSDTGAPVHFDYRDKAVPLAVRFHNITVHYENSPILFKDLNLDIAAGEMVAIRGADGSGRSSFLRLLVNDTPITHGAVYIGEDSDLSKARSSVRYVGPSPAIFQGTVLENLTLFGEVPASAALRVSKTLGLDCEIIRMPLGYDTPLRSGGGRGIPTSLAQRITIARALATNPSVLVLDEANTLLDLNGEKKFVEALKTLHGKVTILIATHRPSITKLADRAYEIADGKIEPYIDNWVATRSASA